MPKNQKQNSALKKLPEITACFWLMKIAATTMGETGGDWLSMNMQMGYLASTAIFFAIFFIALLGQLSSLRHLPLLYWSVILATSTLGTTISDSMDRTLQLGYATGTALLLSLLIALLLAWKVTEGSLSVDDVRSRRAELFYWFTVLISNTLGTALGDFLSDSSGLGFLKSWLLITAALAFILFVRFITRLPPVLLFWGAFVLTRPFGATFGDVLTKTKEQGGLGLGTGNASLVLGGVLLLTMPFCYRKRSNGNWSLVR